MAKPKVFLRGPGSETQPELPWGPTPTDFKASGQGPDIANMGNRDMV